MGKARQSAKTEMEKLKMREMSCAELIKEAAKIIYVVHDEVKDKQFELELSWVGAITQGRHQRVPDNVFAEAERYAKSALEEDSDSGNEDMWIPTHTQIENILKLEKILPPVFL